MAIRDQTLSCNFLISGTYFFMKDSVFLSLGADFMYCATDLGFPLQLSRRALPGAYWLHIYGVYCFDGGYGRLSGGAIGLRKALRALRMDLAQAVTG